MAGASRTRTGCLRFTARHAEEWRLARGVPCRRVRRRSTGWPAGRLVRCCTDGLMGTEEERRFLVCRMEHARPSWSHRWRPNSLGLSVVSSSSVLRCRENWSTGADNMYYVYFGSLLSGYSRNICSYMHAQPPYTHTSLRSRTCKQTNHRKTPRQSLCGSIRERQ